MKGILCMILALSLMLCFWGCGKSAAPVAPDPQSTGSSEESLVVQGTVLAITDTSLTVQTETGEQTFVLTESTLYYRDFGRGGFRPEGVTTNNGHQPPQPPADGQFPGGQQPPMDGQQPPQPPVDGQQPPTDGQQPPMDGQQPSTGGEAPTEGASSSSGGFTPGNGTQQGGSPVPGSPGENGSFETGNRPDPMEPQTVTREEVSVGDMVSLTLDEQGSVLTLTVEGGQSPAPPATEASSN